RVEAEQSSFTGVGADLIAVNARAGVNAASDEGRPGAETQQPPLVTPAGKMPDFLARSCIETIESFIAGTKIDFTRDDGRTRFSLHLGRKVPQQSAGRCIEAAELASGVVMKALADIEAAVRPAWRGEHGLDLAVADEVRDFFRV